MNEIHSIYTKDIERELKDCDYLFLKSVRGTAKSYASKDYAIQRAFQNHEWLYLRRFPKEIKDVDTTDYFNDYNIAKVSKNEYTGIDVFRKRIYLTNEDNHGVEKRVKKMGYTMALSEFASRKSIQLPLVDTIIYEEYCTDEFYLDNEPQKLQHLVSTIFRNRKGKVILIGNLLSRFDPYIEEWGLADVLNQKVGTIDKYILKDDDGNEIVIKVWLIEKKEKKSGMFFGHAARSIDGNEYYVERQNKLPYHIDEYKTIYELVLKVESLAFLMKFIKKGSSDYTWYVVPKTTEIDYNQRIVSDMYSSNLKHTRGFISLSAQEANIFKYIDQGKIAFASDRCGTDFRNAIRILDAKTK